MLSVFGYSVKAYESADVFLAADRQRERGCIVADVRMPGTDGIGLVRELARRGIAMPVVLISGHADVPMAVAAIKSGAKTSSKSRSTTRNWLQRSIARWPGGSNSRICKNRKARSTTRFARLTPRQIEIFDLVVEGFTSHAIAARLNISVRTVESYRAEVMEKMQAESVAGLVRQAIRLGRIAP